MLNKALRKPLKIIAQALESKGVSADEVTLSGFIVGILAFLQLFMAFI